MTPSRPDAIGRAPAAPARPRPRADLGIPLGLRRSGYGQIARTVLGPPWLAPILLAVGAVVLWLISLPQIDLARLTDLGLGSQMPATAFLALVLLTLSFVAALVLRPLRPGILLVNVLLLVVMLFGVTELIQDAPRFSTTYVHAGFAETILRTGELRPILDARFDWPLFFIGAAYLTSVAGFEGPLQLAPWISVVFNLLFLGPLWLILRALTDDVRLRWLTIWIFLIANWVGQDYFAPQALNFFLYLVILAVLLVWFKPGYVQPRWARAVWRGTAGRWWQDSGPHAVELDEGDRRRADQADLAEARSVSRVRPAMVGIAVLVFSLMVASHQLTPVVTLLAVAVLVAFQRLSLRGLPVLMGLMVATWMVFGAATYLSGHLPGIVADLGRAGAVASAGVGDRLRGSFEHQLIVYLRLGFTLVVWGLAAAGAIRRLRHGYLDLTAGLLAATPFILIALQRYGGEMFLRVFLFSLPFMAFFMASLFRPEPRRAGVLGVTALVVVLSLVVLAFPFARYGNERQDFMTAAEIQAMERLYETAAPGSLIVTANYNAPIRYRDLEQYRYRVARHESLAGDVEGLLRIMRDRRGADAYLVLTRSQQATAEIFSGLPTEAWERLEALLRARAELDVFLDSEVATIFVLDEPVQPPAAEVGR